MTLANVQHLLLRLAIDPRYAEAFYRDSNHAMAEISLTEKERAFAAQLPETVISEFQAEVAHKRSGRAQTHFRRTIAYMPHDLEVRIFRTFAAEHVMRSNQWEELTPAFLEHVEREAGDSRAGLVLKEVASFERWIYEFSQSEPEPAAGVGLVLSTDVRLRAFPLPAELLITEEVSPTVHQELQQGYGQTVGYVLAMRTEEGIDLFEIDECYYLLLQQCTEPRSLDALLALVESTARRLSVERDAQEMIRELRELSVLIEVGEED